MAAYAALVFIVSVLPIKTEPAVSHLDKVAHVCEYLLFAWLLVQAIRAGRLRERGYLWLAWIYATSYGLLMELIQGMLPWRSADMGDAAANALGAALGTFLFSSRVEQSGWTLIWKNRTVPIIFNRGTRGK